MFQTTIKTYLDPTMPPTVETFKGTIGEFLVERYGPTGVPSIFYLFQGSMSLTTLCDLDDPATWADADGVFEISLSEPVAGGGGGIIGGLVGAASGLIGLGTRLLLAGGKAVMKAIAPKPPSIAPVAAAANAMGRAQQSPNNSLENRTNSARVNQRIPDIFGDERATFDLITVPVTEFIDNEEFEEFYACIGRGSYQVLDVRDGGSPIVSITGAAASIYGPGTSPNSGVPQQTIGGGVSGSVRTWDQIEGVVGDTLKPTNLLQIDLTGATVSTAGLITPVAAGNLTTAIKVGDNLEVSGSWFGEPASPPGAFDQFTFWDADGVFLVTAVTATTVTINVAGNIAWGFAGNGFISSAYANILAEGQSGYLRDPSIAGYTLREFAPRLLTSADLTVGPYTVPSSVDMFRYNTVAVNGLYRDTGSAVYGLTVELRVEIEKLNADLTSAGMFQNQTITMVGKSTRESAQLTTNVVNPFPGSPTRHRMRRITPRPSTSGQSVSDEIRWRDFFTATDDTPLEFGDVTTIHLRIKATDSALRVKDRSANGRVVRLIPQLGQGWDTPLSPLKDFASVCSAIARDPRIGRMTAAQFDAQVWELERDRLIAYFGDPTMAQATHTFDDTNVTAEESIQLIAQACFSSAYRQGNVVRVLADLPQTESSALFTHRNKHPGSDRRRRTFLVDRRQDGLELSYKSRMTDAFETVVLDVNGGSDPTTPKEIELSGVRTQKQALVHSRRIINRMKFQRITVQFDTLSEGRLIVPTTRVDVVNNTYSGTQDGEIRGADGLTLRLSQPVEMGVGSHSVVLRLRDGTVEGIPVVSVSDDGYVVTLDRLPSAPVYAGMMETRTLFWFGADAESDALAVRIEAVDPTSIDRIKMQGVNYTPRYYEGDLI